ncbi:hemerythrin domain-containing protein [Phenylobacterium sp.]|uniref:hemerythrin domain-containing protein n=1 Tax=Phenylobacterium sp. TaxID=1871053 RepID=UPI0025DC54A7|nr:hemerythrin domain-containing protein [Phenylobacterium sp.]MBX3485862.1 hemerythrin domain-containing protein [Phenylobacterium sp.]MCW5758786.1 hemerythrin domain-containing protein [Phenylobacterium sp.]
MPDDASLTPAPPRGDAAPIRCALMTPDPDARPRPDIAGLIELIQVRYHDTHRREFPEAIRLARKVEAVHAADPGCPKGLADLLALMLDDLESHQRREEQVLFPMLAAGGGPMVRFPIARMMAEHVDVDGQLASLRAITHDFAEPEAACDAWRELMRLCRKLDADLREHMRLENEQLFAAFLG